MRLKFDRFKGFVEEYSANLSLGGMFIRTDDPVPVGTELPIEFRLGEDYELITGRGRVVWVRTPEQAMPDHPAGLGIRFLELTPGSRELIFRMVERRVREGGDPFDLDEAADLLPDRPPEPGPGPERHFALAEAGEGDTIESPFSSLLNSPTPLDLEPLPSPPGGGVAEGRVDAAKAGAPGGFRQGGGEEAAAAGGVGTDAAGATAGRKARRGKGAAADEADSAQGRLPLDSPAPLPGIEDLESLELPPILAGDGADRPGSAGDADVDEGSSPEAGVAAGAVAAVDAASAAEDDGQPLPPGTADAGASVAEPAASSPDPAEAPGFDASDEEAEDADGIAAGTSADSPAGASAVASPVVDPSGDRSPSDPPADPPWSEDAATPAASSEAGSFGSFRSGAFSSGEPWSGSSEGDADDADADADPLEQTGAAYAGASAAGSPSSGRGRWLLLAAAVLLVLAGAGWWWFGMPPFGGGPAGVLSAEAGSAGLPAAADAGAGSDLEPAGASADGPAETAGAAASDGAVAGADPGSEAADGTPPADAADGSVPDAAESSPEASDLSGTPIPPPTAEQRRLARERAAPPPPAEGTRASRVEDVSYVTEDGATLILVRTDSPLRPEDVADFRLDGDNPRHVVQIRGIEQPYGSGRVAVGTAQVERIRSGLHQVRGEGELHLVLDLASPASRVRRVETLGDRLRIEVAGGEGGAS